MWFRKKEKTFMLVNSYDPDLSEVREIFYLSNLGRNWVQFEYRRNGETRWISKLLPLEDFRSRVFRPISEEKKQLEKLKT